MSRRTSRPRPPHATTSANCPCGLSATYDDCCGRLHRGDAVAATAEQLMRSRFTAFAMRDEAYLLRSWHPGSRPPGVDFDPAMRWLRLEIVGGSDSGPFHSEGTVEFRAYYSDHGQEGALHENSRFVRHDGAWVYLDGVIGD